MKTSKNIFDYKDHSYISWCPGCGNFGIINSLKQVLAEIGIDRQKLVLVSGIGQAAKTPQYVNAHMFNGLHGRALPAATAIKASNPELTVIAESGDGCMYGEGGNHFIHTIRRNPDIVCIVHNNMVYGLTIGQASPTSMRGMKTKLQREGVYNEPFNPMAVAVSLNASFVARANAFDIKQTKTILRQAILHKGFALIDVFQACVTFNKLNTHQWYKEHTYYLDDKHNPYDRAQAMQKAFEYDKLPLGILYKNEQNSTFDHNLATYRKSAAPLHKQQVNHEKIKQLLLTYK